MCHSKLCAHLGDKERQKFLRKNEAVYIIVLRQLSLAMVPVRGWAGRCWKDILAEVIFV